MASSPIRSACNNGCQPGRLLASSKASAYQGHKQPLPRRACAKREPGYLLAPTAVLVKTNFRTDSHHELHESMVNHTPQRPQLTVSDVWLAPAFQLKPNAHLTLLLLQFGSTTRCTAQRHGQPFAVAFQSPHKTSPIAVMALHNLQLCPAGSVSCSPVLAVGTHSAP